MNLSFLDMWRRRHDTAAGGGVLAEAEGMTSLLADCELLRARAAEGGVTLDDSPASLEELDQLSPRWRDDPEELLRLGNDAGLYVGTVLVRTVPRAGWRMTPGGTPVVRLASGREVDVVTAGQAWASDGAPQLSQLYAELAEG